MEQPDWVRMPWKDVGEDERTIHREHSADLGDPGRGIRPVPQRQGGEHQVEHCVRERQLLGLGTDEVHRQLRGGERVGGGQHLSRQVDTDQAGQWVARSGAAQELSGATADVKDPPRLGQVLAASWRAVCWTGPNRNGCRALVS